MKQTPTHNSKIFSEVSVLRQGPGLEGLNAASSNPVVRQSRVLQPCLTSDEAVGLPIASISENERLAYIKHLPNNCEQGDLCEMFNLEAAGEAEAHLGFNSLMEMGTRLLMGQYGESPRSVKNVTSGESSRDILCGRLSLESQPPSFQFVSSDASAPDYLRERLSLESQMQDLDLEVPSRSSPSVFSRGIQSWCGTARQASFLDSPPVMTAISATLPSTLKSTEKVTYSNELTTVPETSTQIGTSLDLSHQGKKPKFSILELAAARERWAGEYADDFDMADFAQDIKEFESLFQSGQLRPISPEPLIKAASSSSTEEGSCSAQSDAPRIHAPQGKTVGGGRTLSSSSSSSSSDQPYSSKAPPLLSDTPHQYPPIKPPTYRPSDIPLPPLPEGGPVLLRQACSHSSKLPEQGSLRADVGEGSAQCFSKAAAACQQERRSEPGLDTRVLLSGSNPLTSSYGLLLHGGMRVQPPWRRNSLN